MSARRLDASALRDWAHTAVGDLISHTDEINRLNVFPVADADTGTNMLFTMRAALARADDGGGRDVMEVARALSAGALHGARSEERRVGKECRSRRGAGHERRKERKEARRA